MEALSQLHSLFAHHYRASKMEQGTRGKHLSQEIDAAIFEAVRRELDRREPAPVPAQPEPQTMPPAKARRGR
jgi:hypothetical protein